VGEGEEEGLPVHLVHKVDVGPAKSTIETKERENKFNIEKFDHYTQQKTTVFQLKHKKYI
jgi:hypothetical protein